VETLLLRGALLVAVFIGAARIARQVKVWRQGRATQVDGSLVTRVARAVLDVASHRRIRRNPVSGLIHACLFFTVAFLGPMMVWEHVLELPVALGGLSQIYRSLLDIAGVLLLTGVVAAAIRRFVVRPPRLYDANRHDVLALTLLALLAVSGFAVAAIPFVPLLAIGGPSPGWEMPGAAAMTLALAAAAGAGLLNADPEALAPLLAGAYWTHAGTTIVLVAWLPFGVLRHVVYSFLNIVLVRGGPRAALAPIDFEAESPLLGTRTLDELTWKQRLDLDACTRCGRCHAVCPATAAGRPLSPKRFIQSLRQAMATRDGDTAIVPDVVSEDILWSCTTCGACAEACPVDIAVVDKIVDARRHLVMSESRVPDTAQTALRSLEERGHPWSGTTHTRTSWAEGLGIPTLAEAPDAEYLLWVGCTGALVDRNVKATKALARVLQHAGVRFAILGADEPCTGDPARRLGSELLFQMMAQQTVGMLEQQGAKRIVTQCAHCYNTLANEYPKFGGTYEVTPHVTLLEELQRAGRLPMGSAGGPSVALHDACYLGRANGVFDPPREVLTGAGLALREMPRNRERSFCCGAGGGNAWQSGLPGGKINVLRAQEALDTGAQIVATECPFCLQMLEEGVVDVGGAGRLRPMDVSEVVAESLGLTTTTD